MTTLYLLLSMALATLAWAVPHPYFSKAERERRQKVRQDRWQQQVQAFAIQQWTQENWWRFPPAEGWQVGYNCSPLPYAAQMHIQAHGRILPLTRQEILRAKGLA